MSTPLLDMIRGILPNFADKQLRKMVPWFEGVSNALNQNSQHVAGALIDGAGNIQRRFGMTGAVGHGGTGQYSLTLDQTYDINQLYVTACIYSPTSPPGGAINIYPVFTDGATLDIEIWQIAVTTAARTRVNEQFMVNVFLAPLDQS